MEPVISLQRRLSREVAKLRFGEPVTCVYNPLEYARRSAETYLGRYFRPGVEALWLGMNPGPWGMAQTGVPFGEVSLVREWLEIDERVDQPRQQHAKRPIQGFDCARSEVSGRRLWGWAQSRFASADAFFDRFFVWNWCPLVFMEESGKNRTPDKLVASERGPLEELCDQALRELVELAQPERVIGVGRFAMQRAQRALGAGGPPIDTVLHPSPASPIANRGWAPQIERQLADMGLDLDARPARKR